jgi:hypothetical protein
MKKTKAKRRADVEMRAEYDFSKGVRGKYANRYVQGSNVVVLDPDVAKRFKTSKAVNGALRKAPVKARTSVLRSKAVRGGA